MNNPRIVSREKWLEARKALMAKEKELTRLRDGLAAERRALPWVHVEKQYVFDAPHGKVTLAELFDGRSQLFVKHFMMGPGQVGQASRGHRCRGDREGPDLAPIAVAHEMARKNGTTPGAFNPIFVGLALRAAFAMAIVDARGRPVLASVAYSSTVLVTVSTTLARMPAFRAVATICL